MGLIGRSITASLLAVTLTAGCSRRPPSVAAEPEGGMYEFSAHVGSEILQGTMLVMPDTIVVRAEEAQCIPETMGKDPLVLRYHCRGTPNSTLVIDRKHPASSSKWYGTQVRRGYRTVCDAYGQNALGQRVCLSSRTEAYEQSTPISGMLRMRRPAPMTDR